MLLHGASNRRPRGASTKPKVAAGTLGSSAFSFFLLFDRFWSGHHARSGKASESLVAQLPSSRSLASTSTGLLLIGHLRTRIITSARSMSVTSSKRTSKLLFLSQITKFAFSRVNGSRDLSIRYSIIASSRLNTPLSTRISPVMLFSNLWCPIQNGLEYLLLSHMSNSSRVDANACTYLIRTVV